MLDCAPTTLAGALNETIFLVAGSSSAADAVALGNAVVLGVALSTFAAVILFVILPSVLGVLQEQREVFDVFAAVPLKIVRHVRDRLAERLSALAREASGEEDGAEGAPQGEELSLAALMGDGGGSVHGSVKGADDRHDSSGLGGSLRLRPQAGAGLALAIANANASAARSRSAKDEDGDEESLKKAAALGACRCRSRSPLCCCGGAAGGEDHVARRKFAKATSGFVSLLTRMVWPVLCFVAYYVAMYVTRSQVTKLANESRVSVQWVCELEVLVPSVGQAMRNALAFSEPKFTATWLDVAEERADFLLDVVNAVAFGDPARQLSSQLAVSPAAYSILLVNGCVDNVLSDAECANYNLPSGCTYFYPMKCVPARRALSLQSPRRRAYLASLTRPRPRAAPRRIAHSLCYKDPASVDITQPIFDSGLVGTGLLPAIQRFVLKVKELCRLRRLDLAAAAAAGGTAPGALDGAPLPRQMLAHDGSSFDTISQLAKSYLPAGLTALSDATLSQATNSIRASMSVDVLAVVLSCCALVGFYVVSARDAT